MVPSLPHPQLAVLSPVEIRFDNQLSPGWTVVETHSEDAFGFLYAVSNAFAMLLRVA